MKAHPVQAPPSPIQNPLKPDQIRVILVETQGEANLGAIARSLSCFAVQDWVLVRPRVRPSTQARNWACHGREWLEHLRVVDDLQEALLEVDLAVALTGKSGKRRHRMTTPAGLSGQVIPQFQLGRLALIFGNEESGLDNADLDLCHWRVKIPTDEVHNSLNLAHSVTLMLYELVGRGLATDLGGKPVQLAPPEVLRRALEEFAVFLSQQGYPGHDARLEEEMRKVQEVVHRARLEGWEVNLFLGMIRHLRNTWKGRSGSVDLHQLDP